MRARPRKRERTKYLLPLTLDLPIGIGGIHSAISRAVGEFYEEATCQLFSGERLKSDGQIFCPDTLRGEDFFEVKGSGQSGWIIEERQHSTYCEMAMDGKGLTYVLWSYRGRPTLKSSCPTRRAVFAELAKRTMTCWVLGLDLLVELLREAPLHSFGYHNGDTTKYYRPRKRDLPQSPVIVQPKLEVEIESVPFVMYDIRVITCLRGDSICVDDVPF